MPGLTKVNMVGTLQGVDSTDVVTAISTNFSTVASESGGGSVLLSKASVGLAVLELPDLSKPNVLQMKSGATVVAYLNTATGTYANVTFDGMCIVQLATNCAVVSIGVSHVGATTATRFDWWAGGL
jgi:hypothetical protein